MYLLAFFFFARMISLLLPASSLRVFSFNTAFHIFSIMYKFFFFTSVFRSSHSSICVVFTVCSSFPWVFGISRNMCKEKNYLDCRWQYWYYYIYGTKCLEHKLLPIHAGWACKFCDFIQCNHVNTEQLNVIVSRCAVYLLLDSSPHHYGKDWLANRDLLPHSLIVHQAPHNNTQSSTNIINWPLSQLETNLVITYKWLTGKWSSGVLCQQDVEDGGK